MAVCPTCPYCEPEACELCDYELRNIMYTDEWRTQFFQNVEIVKCPICSKDFYTTEYYYYRDNDDDIPY